MKFQNIKPLLTILFLCNIIIGLAQDTWTQKANFPGNPKYAATGISVGNRGFVVGGFNPQAGNNNAFWEYNPDSNIWTERSPFPGTNRYGGTGFCIGNKLYYGTGLIGTFYTSDFWEYNTVDGKWTAKANIPVGRVYAVGFSIGNKGYITTGNFQNSIKNDLWEYNPDSNSWTQKTSIPAPRMAAIGFSIENRGYVGTGYSGTTRLNDFWAYNPDSDLWTQKANISSILRNGAIGFKIGKTGYIGLGDGTGIGNEQLTDLWAYNPINNLWTPRKNFEGIPRIGAVAFGIENKAYIGTGKDTSFANSLRNDIWEYNPGSVGFADMESQAEKIQIYPNPNKGLLTLVIRSGFKNEIKYAIINNLGEEIYSLAATEIFDSFTKEINLNHLSDGMYFIRVELTNKTTFLKLMIKKD